MIPRLIFPDVVAWACSYLRDALGQRPEPYTENVHVGANTPDPRKNRMVIVREDGGARLDDGVRDSCLLGINVWATSEQEARQLAQLVRSLLWAAPDGSNGVVRVESGTRPVMVPDESKQARAFFTIPVVVTGSPL